MGKLRDLTGINVGDFKVMKFDTTKGKYKYYWICECQKCKQQKSIETSTIVNKNKRNLCRCNPEYANKNYIGYHEDLTGQIFGNLTVLKYVGKSYSHSKWQVQCSCGRIFERTVTNLKSKKLQQVCPKCSVRKKKSNEYHVKESYVVGFTHKGEEFLFDIDDYDKVKNYCWRLNSGGYAVTTVLDNNNSRKEIFLHNLVMNSEPRTIDHENRVRTDNRKSNLRKSNRSDNASNISLRKDNTSGIIGLNWHERLKKWEVSLQKNRKSHYLGVYENKKEAIVVRLRAEKDFFGEFAPQKHLFEEYGVEV